MRSLALVVAVCACGGGGSSAGKGTVDGPLFGRNVTIADAVSTVITGSTLNAGIVVLSSTPHLCADLGNNIVSANSALLTIATMVDNGTGTLPPTADGDYAIRATAGPSSSLTVVQTDATCSTSSSQAKAATGSVSLATIQGPVLDGTFDVVLDNGEHSTGTFAPSSCPAIATFYVAQGHVCT